MLSMRCNSALNHEEIEKYLQITSKIKHFLNKYNWKAINCPSGKDDGKNFKKNNIAIALNFLYIKNEYIFCLNFKTQCKSSKINIVINDSQGIRMPLPCKKHYLHY